MKWRTFRRQSARPPVYVYEQVFTEYQVYSPPYLPFDITDNNAKIDENNLDNNYIDYHQSGQAFL